MPVSKFLKIVLVVLVICIIVFVGFFYLTVTQSKPTSVEVTPPVTAGEIKEK